MKKTMLLVFIISQLLGVSAFADCRYDGKDYKTGEKAAGATCQKDGTWR